MFDPKIIPKTIIFHDNLQEAANAAKYLNSLFPETMQHTRFVKHYHSKMSANYLERTFQDFSLADGTTRILCATSGASTVCGQTLFLNSHLPLSLRDLMCWTSSALSSTACAETSRIPFSVVAVVDARHQPLPSFSYFMNLGP